MSRIADITLAPSGEVKINWVVRNMPVLRALGEDFAKTRPFAGLRVALSVHLEAKTAYLCRVLEMGGAEMHVTGSNPLSTQDDVAAALAAGGMDGAGRKMAYAAALRDLRRAGPGALSGSDAGRKRALRCRFRGGGRDGMGRRVRAAGRGAGLSARRRARVGDPLRGGFGAGIYGRLSLSGAA